MLAYVFWHTALTDARSEEYEQWLTAFHGALWSDPLPGFIGSMSFRMDRAPWLPSAGPVYEDWYLVEHSGALDTLNAAAVSARRQVAHDRVAALAGSGAGGLYRLRKGQPALDRTRVAVWLSKPRAESYEAFYAALGQRLDQGVVTTVWARQMVLGPTPEFCLHAGRDTRLPADLGVRVTLTPVWSGFPADGSPAAGGSS